MKNQDFIRRRIGRLCVLDDLVRHGPSRCKKVWYQPHIKKLRERGLIQKSTTVLHGWEITDKGRKAYGLLNGG